MAFERTDVAVSARIIVLTAAAFALAVCVTGPLALLNTLDLKPGVLRDYHIYLAQSRAYLAHDSVVGHFVYPPLLAVLLIPFSLLPRTFGDVAWWVVQAGLLGGYASVLARVLQAHGRMRWPLAVALLATSLSILHCLKWGQISIALAWLGAAWSIAPSRGTALGLGLAAACKVYPLLFSLPALAWPQRRKVLEVAAFALALGVALPIAVLGVTATVDTLQHFVRSTGDAAAMSSSPASQDLANALRLWFGPGGRVGVHVRSNAWLFVLPAAVQRVLYGLIALGLLSATWHAARRARGGSAAVGAMVMLVVPLLLPIAWEHYYCALPLAVAAALARPGVDRRVLALALCAWAIPMLGLWAQLFEDWNFFTYESVHATTLSALLGVAAMWGLARHSPA